MNTCIYTACERLVVPTIARNPIYYIIFLGEYNFLSTPTFPGRQLARKTRVTFTHYIFNPWATNAIYIYIYIYIYIWSAYS